MPADTWPAALPGAFEFASYQEQEGDGLLRSQTDTGPGKVRRRSSAVPRTVSGTLRLTPAQLDAARAFVRVTLMGGALPFWFPDQVRGHLVLVRLREMPTWRRAAAGRFDFDMSLEVLP